MSHSRPIIALIIICLINIGVKAQIPNWKQGILVDEFIYTEAPYPSCHAATIAETPVGLVAAWFGGTKERNPDVGIWVSRLEGGKWTPSVEVANGVQNDTLRYPTWNPVLFQIPNGELMLFYKIGPSPSIWWGMLLKSSDHGKTWGKPQTLPEGFIGPVKNKPILLANGTLICPSSTEGKGGWRVHFECTPDFGKTWEKIGPINDGKTFFVIQPSILTYPDGSLQILCRSQNRAIVESKSVDGGKTWSSMTAISLPNNHVLPPKGETKGARTPLNVSVSKDGQTWYAALILEDSEISQYSYPSVIQASDGLVHIVYTWRRERIKHVVVDPAKLQLKEIKNGEWPK
ncbi:MAG: exo-alpha-sialidase [Bacteroidia bacterium]|nr:exo-alpha-sialidase [Bacteroidia bacterium]